MPSPVIIGRILATEKAPTTIDNFAFWTNPSLILNPFRVVLVTTASIHLQVYFHGQFTICISQIGLETWNSCC